MHGRTCSRRGSPRAVSLSDLSQAKLRPAVVLASAGRGDWILCQITSNPYGDPLALELTAGNFASGSLRITSYARPGKLFTAHESLVRAVVGQLESQLHTALIERVMALLRAAGA